MSLIKEEPKLEILLRPTIGRIGSLVMCMAAPVTLFFWMLFHLLNSTPFLPRNALMAFDVVLFLLSVYCIYYGVKGLLRGKLQLSNSGLIIEREGKSQFLSYGDISDIALTKTLAGRSSSVQVVVFNMKNNRKFCIYNYYERTAEDLFHSLKSELERKGLPITCAFKPGIFLMAP